MNRRAVVAAAIAFAVLIFGVAAFAYTRIAQPDSAKATVVSETTGLERFHSPVIGPMNAPVTIVEFFDPSCEACRAFYPIVKQIMARYPNQVRLVMRYAALHRGSDEAVRILEAARKQNLFVPVLEALLNGQPGWAKHEGPDLRLAWSMAATAGLDEARARQDARAESVDAVLKQDMADVEAFKVEGTPSFFVNGQPLLDFGPQQLADAVASALAATD